MSMNGAALAAALEASQAKAIAALGKAYVRRDEEPDQDLFRQLMKGMGLDDDFAITFLFHAWDVLREQREQPPGAENGQPAKEDEPASERQLSYIASLADEKGHTAPDTAGLTKAKASELISELQAGTYDPEKWEVPF
jgi:hypothetical protein